MQRIRKALNNQRGVTLIELLAVVVILGIIAAVAVPVVLNQVDNAKTNASVSDEAIVLDAAQRYFILNSGESSVTVAKLVTDGFLKEEPANLGFDTVEKTTSTSGGTTVTTGLTTS